MKSKPSPALADSTTISVTQADMYGWSIPTVSRSSRPHSGQRGEDKSRRL
jgi:hypothetical protein